MKLSTGSWMSWHINSLYDLAKLASGSIGDCWVLLVIPAHTEAHAWMPIHKPGCLAALSVECPVLKWLDRYRGVNCQFQFVLLKSAGAAFQRESTWNWQWQSGIGFVRREKSEQNDWRRTWPPTSPCTCPPPTHTHTIMEAVMKALYPPCLSPFHLCGTPCTHTHSSSSCRLRSHSPWQSSSVLQEQMIVSLDKEWLIHLIPSILKPPPNDLTSWHR